MSRYSYKSIYPIVYTAQLHLLNYNQNQIIMKHILFSICVLIFLFSCSDDDSNTVETPEANFYALTVGNSWVYKNYRYDMNSQAYEDTGVVDSVSVVGTEIVDNNTFFKFRRKTTGNESGITFCNSNGEHFERVRDSLGYLIWDTGQVKFVHTNFEERIISEEAWGSIRETLQEGETNLSVEAGTFTSVNSERYVILPDGEQAPALDKFYYSDGIGLIYDTSSFVSQDIPLIIRRLDAYTIQ